MKTEPNHSASPIKQFDWIGLTKREYFAAMAMSSFCRSMDGQKNLNEAIQIAAIYSAKAADALINALNQKNA